MRFKVIDNGQVYKVTKGFGMTGDIYLTDELFGNITDIQQNSLTEQLTALG